MAATPLVAVAGRSLRTNLSTFTWSPDGARITKSYDLGATEEAFAPRRVILGHHHRRPRARTQFSYELRVNQLLSRHPPALPTPRLIDHDRRAASLTFEAVDGEPLGPKYPLELSDDHVGGLIALARATGSYRHRPRWLRRFPIRSRLWSARRAALVTETEHQSLLALSEDLAIDWVFAHGDITARNVLDAPVAPVLIDWEWAGLYPDGYDLALVWFALVDRPGGRAAVEAAIGTDPRTFWLSALLIELLHLEFGVPEQFRSTHVQTKEWLLGHVLGSN
jgi:Ser/Thr protein kinase RdoA (MazF antagonist)